MNYLDVLNEQQKEAVVHYGSPLLILAGAGSGKTRVITTKIAYLIQEMGVDPYQILAVTFTKKTANEMRERAIALENRSQYSQIRTFHSFGSWFLRLYAEYAGVDSNFTVYDDDDMALLVAKAVPRLTKKEASIYAHKISLAKDYCYLPDDKRLVDIDSSEDFADIYDAYQKRLRDTGNVDFGDLIMLPYLVMQKNEEIRKKMQNRFRVVMVDEYQDSNVAQFLLLQTLTGVQENSGVYVCVVGDDDQSIYKFRGAEVQNILNFQKLFPDTKIIRLESNYRSTAQILKIADEVVSNNSKRLGKTLMAERGEGDKPVLIFLPDQDEEATYCADLIERFHDEQGANYSDWAILYRTNAQSLTFESTFLHRKIPYQVVGSLKFYEREEIKDLLAYLSLLANPKDEIAFRRVINKPTRGIGDKAQEKIIGSYRNSLLQEEKYDNIIDALKKTSSTLTKNARQGAEQFCAVIEEASALLQSDSKPQAQPKLSQLIDIIIEKSLLKEHYDGADLIAGTQKTLNMQELSNNASQYELSLDGLLEFLDAIELDRTVASLEEEINPDKVTLITFHNTKGLEFKRVIMTGMESGIFPRQDKMGVELEEERRLCYVGITRAMNELYLTSCSMRRMYGRSDFMTPSVFLSEINKENLKIIDKRAHDKAYSNFGYNSTSYAGNYGIYGRSNPKIQSDPLKRKYCKGAKVYHDDYGYGIIVSTKETDDGEYVVEVKFENFQLKKFLPKYQKSDLIVIKD